MIDPSIVYPEEVKSEKFVADNKDANFPFSEIERKRISWATMS